MIIKLKISFEADYNYSRLQQTLHHILVLLRQMYGIRDVELIETED